MRTVKIDPAVKNAGFPVGNVFIAWQKGIECLGFHFFSCEFWYDFVSYIIFLSSIARFSQKSKTYRVVSPKLYFLGREQGRGRERERKTRAWVFCFRDSKEGRRGTLAGELASHIVSNMGFQRVFNPLVGCGAKPCVIVDSKKQGFALRYYRPLGGQ
jgi:hypothetical protein